MALTFFINPLFFLYFIILLCVVMGIKIFTAKYYTSRESIGGRFPERTAKRSPSEDDKKV